MVAFFWNYLENPNNIAAYNYKFKLFMKISYFSEWQYPQEIFVFIIIKDFSNLSALVTQNLPQIKPFQKTKVLFLNNS